MKMIDFLRSLSDAEKRLGKAQITHALVVLLLIEAARLLFLAQSTAFTAIQARFISVQEMAAASLAGNLLALLNTSLPLDALSLAGSVLLMHRLLGPGRPRLAKLAGGLAIHYAVRGLVVLPVLLSLRALLFTGDPLVSELSWALVRGPLALLGIAAAAGLLIVVLGLTRAPRLAPVPADGPRGLGPRGFAACLGASLGAAWSFCLALAIAAPWDTPYAEALPPWLLGAGLLACALMLGIAVASGFRLSEAGRSLLWLGVPLGSAFLPALALGLCVGLSAPLPELAAGLLNVGALLAAFGLLCQIIFQAWLLYLPSASTRHDQ